MNVKEMNTQELIKAGEHEIEMIKYLENTIAQETMNGADITALNNEVAIRKSVIAEIKAELDVRAKEESKEVENEVTVEPVENDLSNLETLVGTTFNATSIVYSMNDRTEEVIVSDTNVTNNFEDFGVCTLHIAYYNILNSNIYNIWVDSNNTIVKVH